MDSGAFNTPFQATVVFARVEPGVFEASFSVTAVASTSAPFGDASGVDFVDSIATINFTNSAHLLGMRVYDEQGNEVPGTFISDSGVNYAFAPAPVPEPASLALVGSAVLFGAARRLRRPARP
ncbi:MAG: PEP-CTERM sorting domain-containing protein [Gemmataceae bacterium]|nr:PEP-CTERM sorting domain-containing protein [Gemmataceae bacterium]